MEVFMNGSELLGIVAIAALSMVAMVAMALGMVPRFVATIERVLNVRLTVNKANSDTAGACLASAKPDQTEIKES